ncbi:MAG: hypothetical protein AAB424_04385 [Patescibacteria group bacterium]
MKKTIIFLDITIGDQCLRGGGSDGYFGGGIDGTQKLRGEDGC